MRTHLRSFLEYLRLNRNLSAHTVRAYQGDLTQYLSFLERYLDRPAERIGPSDVDQYAIRAFMGELYDRGHARASSARRLAAIRITASATATRTCARWAMTSTIRRAFEWHGRPRAQPMT